MPEREPIQDVETQQTLVETLRPLGAMALLSEIQSNVVLAGEQAKAYPMNENARTMLGRIAGLEVLPPGREITQSTVEAIFEQLVYPVFQEARQHSPRGYDAVQVTKRLHEVQLYVAGHSPSEILKRTGISSNAALIANRYSFVKTLQGNGYDAEHFRSMLGRVISHGNWSEFEAPNGIAVQLHRVKPIIASRKHKVASMDKETTEAGMVENNPPDLDEEAVGGADAIRLYLNQIGRYPLINAEEEVEKSKRIEAGLYAGHKLAQAAENGKDLTLQTRRDLQWVQKDGERAKDEMLQANLRLVVSLAKRYTGHGMSFLDLIQEGNMGLIRAVEKFDYTKGFKFSTYATWWIRQGISRAMADQSRTIRVPVHMAEQINKLARITRELQNQGMAATLEELAIELDITPDKVRELQGYSREPVSLDLMIGHDSDTSFDNFVADSSISAPSDDVEKSERNRELQEVIGMLGTREQAVIKMRYGLGGSQPMTLDEVGRVFKLTRERIRQIEKEAMRKLRDPILKQSLEGLLED